MAAIAHGWRPPAKSPVADIPVTVAKEFLAADTAKRSSGGGGILAASYGKKKRR